MCVNLIFENIIVTQSHGIRLFGDALEVFGLAADLPNLLYYRLVDMRVEPCCEQAPQQISQKPRPAIYQAAPLPPKGLLYGQSHGDSGVDDKSG